MFSVARCERQFGGAPVVGRSISLPNWGTLPAMAESPTSNVLRPTCFRRRNQIAGGTPLIWGSCYPLDEGCGARCNARCRSSACLRRPVVPSTYDSRLSTSSGNTPCLFTRWFRKSSQSTVAGHEESCEWLGETLVMGRLGCCVIEQVSQC